MLSNTKFAVFKKCFYFLLLLLCSPIHVVKGHTINDVERVLDDIFDSTNYNKLIRGQTDLSVPMNITVDLALKSIIRIDEKQESVEVLAILFVDWKDDRLVWNSTAYNGTYEVMLPAENVWHPEIFVERVTSHPIMFGDPERQLTLHSSSGQVRMSVVELFKFSCSFDLTSFPWDIQTCDIIFTVWGYLKRHIRLSSNLESIKLDFYVENSSWEIVSSRVFQADYAVKPRIAFQIVLRRRPEFFVITIFLPVAFLSVMSLLVYAVPIESGERISFSLTTLLSIVLFITVLSASIPQSAETIPSMCYFLLSELALCLLVCLCNIISMNYYYKDIDKEKPGSLLKKLAILCRGNCCLKSQKVQLDYSNDGMTQTNHTKDVINDSTEKSQLNQVEIDWKDISRMLDNMFIIVMILCTVFIYCMFASHMAPRE